MANLNVCAIDMGSSSIRAVLGSWDGHTLERREILRVPHQAYGEPLVWDVARISSAAREAVSEVTAMLGRVPDGVGVCGWGVDFLGVDARNCPTTPARAYRGSQGARGRAALGVGDWEAFQESGVYPQDINSIYQIAGLLQENKDYFSASSHIEFLADWVARDLASAQYGPFESYCAVPAWISAGVGSTSGFLGVNRSELVASWDHLGVDSALIPPVASELSIAAQRDGMAVIRAGSHDTACAAYSLGSDFEGAFISCGSWAIVGAITHKPVLTREAFAAGITNEAATDGRNRAQVNLTGMWIAQECRRYWASKGWKPSYAELDQLTFAANVPDGVLDVSNPELMNAGDMPEKITRLAKETLRIDVREPGEILALAQRSVAYACARAVDAVKRIAGIAGEIALIGGGVRDPYLVHSMREYMPDLIVADPESSALGNITAQLVALGVAEEKISSWRQTHRPAQQL